MLHTVTQLAQNSLRNIGRTLGHEVDAHTLTADEANDLLNLVNHGLGGVVEEHVSLIEEEHEFRQIEVAHLRQSAVKFAHEPQQEGGVELGLEHELVGSKHIHDTLATLALQQVVDFKFGLAKEQVATLVLKPQKGALNGTYRCSGNVAILRGIVGRVLADEVEQ